MTRLSLPRLGIVIPTLNEAANLPVLLEDLGALRIPHRVVVADGGSRDGTPDLAVAGGARVVESAPGRGTQLRAGVATLRAPWLLLLHADGRFPPAARRALEEWLAVALPSQVAHFGFHLDGPGRRLRWIERGQRIRERLTGLVFGDQGLVVHRSRLEAVGGIPDLPVMEDVELVRRLRRRGPLHRLTAELPVNPRRYRRDGTWLGPLRNAALLGLYLAGLDARTLARWYRPEPGIDPPPALRRLLVFARAPVQGRVKTRLAAGIGPEAALDAYRWLGRRVVDQVRHGPYRIDVYHDPPGASSALKDWLGSEGVVFRPQHPGDLGTRMAAALLEAFREGAPMACVIGTDAPGVDRWTVEAAFDALGSGADVVFGPALDGGYYLLALREPREELFHDVPWSTDQVLQLSLDRCRRLGLEVALLDPLLDVDTEADLLAARGGTPGVGVTAAGGRT